MRGALILALGFSVKSKIKPDINDVNLSRISPNRIIVLADVHRKKLLFLHLYVCVVGHQISRLRPRKNNVAHIWQTSEVSSKLIRHTHIPAKTLGRIVQQEQSSD